MGKQERNRKKRVGVPAPLARPRSRRQIFSAVRSAVVGVVDAPDDVTKLVGPESTNPLAKISIVGSGVVIDPAGVIITAEHVVRPWHTAAEEFRLGRGPRPPLIKVLFITRAETNGENTEWRAGVAPVVLYQIAPKMDLAVLAVAPPPELSLSWLEPTAQPCEEGDQVAVCGYPLGQHLHRDLLFGTVLTPSFSQGIVSAALPFAGAPQAMQTYFQVDATINGGNSGGPVFDVSTGKLLGVVSSRSMTNYSVCVPTSDPDQDQEGEEQAGGYTKGRIGVPTGLSRCIHIHRALPQIAVIKARLAALQKERSQSVLPKTNGQA